MSDKRREQRRPVQIAVDDLDARVRLRGTFVINGTCSLIASIPSVNVFVAPVLPGMPPRFAAGSTNHVSADIL